MADQTDWDALSVFLFFFILVTVMGFCDARWKSGPVTEHLDEWGLGGRQFGTWITWFLVGGDFYTAHTVIAVPALVYAVGAYGFFALPYTIIVYPFVFAVMPVLWKVAHAKCDPAAGLCAAARPDRAARLHGLCRQHQGDVEQRRGADAVQGSFS